MMITGCFISTTSRLYSKFPRSLQNYSEVRVRFGPSPTGSIHLGGLRTAFYNYIFAKQYGGKFILRIEDTDQSRVVPGSAEDIEYFLNWAGLRPDESPNIGGNFGPYIQSLRLDLYQKRALELVDSGKAYRCFCSPTRLDLLRKYQSRNREKPRYDGKCRHLSQTEIDEKLAQSNGLHVIRFALIPEATAFEDLIFGKISNDFSATPESDPIIIKSDKFPTYHFANVVDDHEMKITHVLRGSEWLSSTSKHVQLYRAFGWTQPGFAHFPLITMKDGAKMSKRNNQSHVKSFRDSGYRPIALLNFLTNMGGGVPKEKQDSSELWDLSRIVEEFDFSKVTCHPGSVDIERLNRYNSKDIQKKWSENPQEIIEELKELLVQHNIITDMDDGSLIMIVGLFIDRITTTKDLLQEKHRYIWERPTLTWSREEYLKKGWNLREIIQDVIQVVGEHGVDEKVLVDSKLKDLCVRHCIERSLFMGFLRKLLTNSEKGLPIHELFNCLGQKRLLSYLDGGLKYVG